MSGTLKGPGRGTTRFGQVQTKGHQGPICAKRDELEGIFHALYDFLPTAQLQSDTGASSVVQDVFRPCWFYAWQTLFFCSTVAQGLASQMAPRGWVAYLRWSNHVKLGFSPLFCVKAQAGCILWPEQNDLAKFRIASDNPSESDRLDFNKVLL